MDWMTTIPPCWHCAWRVQLARNKRTPECEEAGRASSVQIPWALVCSGLEAATKLLRGGNGGQIYHKLAG